MSMQEDVTMTTGHLANLDKPFTYKLDCTQNYIKSDFNTSRWG